MATGLARITVSTPHRRLDVALPEQAPVAELLPELVRHAGAAGEADVGWVLRRVDGAALSPVRGLAAQGIVDGEVLHLTPVRQDWPQPAYDDPAEAIAAGARRRGPQWSAATTRVAMLALAALLLAGGLAAVLYRAGEIPPAVPAAIAGAALLSGVLAARRHGQRVTGALLGGSALPYAFVAGAVWAAPDGPVAPGALAPGALAVAGGAGALLAASLLGAVAGGAAPDDDHGPDGRRGRLDGRFVYVAGITIGLLGAPAALAAGAWGAGGAAAVLACVLVCGVGTLPMVAIRLGGLPVPPLGAGSASPGVLGRDVADAAVARADEVLTGALAGWAVLATATVGVLLVSGGPAGQVLAAVTATALALRARLFVAVRQRLPLVAGALVGYGLLAASLVVVAPAGTVPVMVAVAAGGALLAADGAGRAAPAVSPRVGRLADVADTLAMVAVVPVAAAVLDLYTTAHTLLASPPLPSI